MSNLPKKPAKPAPKKEPLPEPLKIPVESFCDKKVKAGKIRPYEIPALLIFFKKHGLSEIETLDKYEDTFRKF